MWEPRYIVVSPRRHSPSMRARTGSGSSSESPDFVVLNWFRSLTDFSVCGKAWLNGAQTDVSEHDGRKELVLTLNRYVILPSQCSPQLL